MLSKKPRIVEVEPYSTIEDFEIGDRVYRLAESSQQIDRGTVVEVTAGSMFLSLDSSPAGELIEVTENNTGTSAENSTILQWGKMMNFSLVEEGATLSTLLPEYAANGERVYGTVLELIPGRKLVLEDQEYPYSTVIFESVESGLSLEDTLAGWELED